MVPVLIFAAIAIGPFIGRRLAEQRSTGSRPVRDWWTIAGAVVMSAWSVIAGDTIASVLHTVLLAGATLLAVAYLVLNRSLLGLGSMFGGDETDDPADWVNVNEALARPQPGPTAERPPPAPASPPAPVPAPKPTSMFAVDQLPSAGRDHEAR